MAAHRTPFLGPVGLLLEVIRNYFWKKYLKIFFARKVTFRFVAKFSRKKINCSRKYESDPFRPNSIVEINPSLVGPRGVIRPFITYHPGDNVIIIISKLCRVQTLNGPRAVNGN